LPKMATLPRTATATRMASYNIAEDGDFAVVCNWAEKVTLPKWVASLRMESPLMTPQRQGEGNFATKALTVGGDFAKRVIEHHHNCLVSRM
jgi:hypothetical protein